MRDRMPRTANRTASDRPRDRKRTAQAKALTITRKQQRANKRARIGG